jgi:phenylalanyl-tRNA synthetase beta chain
VKKDVVQSLVEAGYNKDQFYIDDETPGYYHPGKSGRIFLNKGKEKVIAFFGDIHPNILKKLNIKVETLVGFEIFLDNIKQSKNSLKNQKTQYKYSDYQKSERDFAFVLDKDFKVQELIEIITKVDKDLIKSVKVFDVYEGDNIDEGKKSIALNVTIQSLEKTLNEEDLNQINQLIISTVESKTDAKIRS